MSSPEFGVAVLQNRLTNLDQIADDASEESRQVTQKIQFMTLTMATKASLPHRWSSSSQSDRKTIDNNDPRSDCMDHLCWSGHLLLAEEIGVLDHESRL